MDWREAGQEIYAWYRQRELEVAARILETRRQRQVRGSKNFTGEEELVRAIIRLVQRGDATQLIEFLRSDKEFRVSDGERKWLAQFLQRKPLPRTGRPPKTIQLQTCGLAKSLYLIWKEFNKQQGIPDWGFRDTMKDESCNYAIEIATSVWGVPTPDFESVRQLMDRPRSRLYPRRKSRQKGEGISA
jgi:hypothetical protein